MNRYCGRSVPTGRSRAICTRPDPEPDARPLKRVIQRHVQDPLAEMILAGDIVDGDTVAISTGGNVLTFNGKAPQTAEIAQFAAPAPKRKLH